MPVQFILDCFGIDQENARVVKTNDEDILAARSEIKQHLSQRKTELLRIRVHSPALLKRFSDYEGMNGVLLTLQLIPRLWLKQKLQLPLPNWLTDELIIRLGLLQKTITAQPQRSLEANLLIACHADLLSTDLAAFFNALKQQQADFLLLLKIPSLAQRLKHHLQSGLGLSESVATLLMSELVHTDSIAQFLAKLTYQQQLEQLRSSTKKYGLNQALPAKTLDSSLLQALPNLTPSENDINLLQDKFISTLQTLNYKIQHGECMPGTIAEPLRDWPLVLNTLEELLQDSPLLKTPALLQQLTHFTSPQSQQILAKLQQPSCALLSDNASVEEVLAWSDDYFACCRQAFLDKQTPDEALNLSFSQWLLTHQQATISRSKQDWRQLSQQVCRYLEQAYVVVVIMVDALSALHQDLILEQLGQVPHLTLQHDILFAPLPTLTEVGKMAVLTGQPANTLSGSQESILSNRYQTYLSEPNALKVLKSWKDNNERITEQTQLLVYFENRLDERLHDCVSFAKHREDLKTIISGGLGVKNLLEKWRKDAAYLNKEIVFFITADHGMTVSQQDYSGQNLGEIKERVFKLSAPVELSTDFVSIENYAVPKKRWRLTPNAVLTHGGLTPEEVLIPLITLTSKPPKPSQTPLEISLPNLRCKKQGYCSWELELILHSRVDVDSIEVSLDPPFSGKVPLDSLRAGKAQTLSLNFTSNQEQEGLVEMDFQLTYHHTTGNEKNQKRLTVEFPQSLLEKDNASQSFEDMF
jgi:hypothetical protein